LNRESSAAAGPLRRLPPRDVAGGVVLLAAAVCAFAWANSPWAPAYVALWNATLVGKPLLLWVNEGLMTLFFLGVGLELKRERIAGELREPRRAALPLLCAVGGMAAPAAVYALLNLGSPTLRGWAIPAATDIAFAIGVLALLGPRAPFGLKVFLTALAIADDLGAVVVIAAFYASAPFWPALAAAGALLGAAFALNRAGVRAPLAYGAVGLALWAALESSGVHATIAGVAIAFAIPAHDGSRAAAGGVARDSLLARLEHALRPLNAFLVMPLFALANAGVALHGAGADGLASPVALGVALGLVVGKSLGIVGTAAAVVHAGIATLPSGVGWPQLGGAACLAGIGFTMSLFIAGLAFAGDAQYAQLAAAKLGILGGSLASGALGCALLALARRPVLAAA
jgi:NhaA family Na+:H+ antiporter